jgi:phosphate transport system substrate-binding protein
VVLTDQPGAGAWPIAGASFVLMHKKQQDGNTGRAVLRFFDWGYRRGTAAATALGYVPMPAAVIGLVQKSWAHDLTDASGQPIWPADKHAEN